MNSQAAVESLRAISKTAFGQTHRLELMLEILETEDGIVSLAQLADALEVTPSSLQRPFDALVELGMLQPLPDVETRFRHFIRNGSLGWTWAQELARDALEYD